MKINVQNEILTAFYLSLAGFIWAILEFVFGLHTTRIHFHATITWFAIIPTLIIYLWHYYKIKKINQAEFTFWKAFKTGAIVSIIASILNPIGFALFFYFVNPNLFNAFQLYVTEKKLMSLEEAKHNFNLSSYLIQICIGSLIMGLIISLILSLIFKNKSK